jgi:hypothetical protein
MEEPKPRVREIYEAPTIDDVPLQSEDTVLVACKGDHLHNGANTGTTCRTIVACRTS